MTMTQCMTHDKWGGDDVTLTNSGDNNEGQQGQQMLGMMKNGERDATQWHNPTLATNTRWWGWFFHFIVSFS